MDVTLNGVNSPLLEELASKLVSLGNRTLDGVVREFWCDFFGALVDLPLGDDRSAAERIVAALFASRVHLQADSLTESLRYALAVSDVSDARPCNAYTERIIAEFVDRYTRHRTGGGSGDQRGGLHVMRLEDVIDRMFRKCLDTDRFQLAVRLALKTRRMDMFVKSLDKSSDNTNDMLLYAMRVATNNLDNRRFRVAVLRCLVSFYQNQKVIDYVNLSRCFIFLDNPKSVAQILGNLIKNNDDKSRLMAYQIAFDLLELANQHYLFCVIKFLKQTVSSLCATMEISEPHCNLNDKYVTATSTVALANDSVGVKSVFNSYVSHQSENKLHQEIMQKLMKVLVGDVGIEQKLLFLTRNNHTDKFILKNTKEAIHSNVCHAATIIANGFMHSGTTCDQFLRDYLKFVNWTTWQLFPAIVSFGVIHKGHETNAIELVHSFLSTANINSAESLEYSIGGGLYALGMIHVNHGAAINDYLLRQLKDSYSEIIKHGCCLGIGLSAMGTGRRDIYEQLKIIMYQDNAMFSEAIGLAIGLVMLGSNNGAALQDMVAYAQITRHEEMLRGLAVGISLFMYDRQEEADLLITSLLKDINPIMRCSAVYTISMAYCGTGNENAVKNLLHTANSDVSDDVRSAAVTGLGFLLFRMPEYCLKIITTLSKSYNPYIRYGAAVALGVAFAGTGHGKAIKLLKLLTNDLINFVRQGALIASALIFFQQIENTYSNVTNFRNLYANVISDENGDDVVKFGAILAQGIIDGGGRNVSISFELKNGHTNMLTVIGLLLFTQYQYCIFLTHCLTLAFSPVCIIELNTFEYKLPIVELQTSRQTNNKVCFNSICQELAEQKGWIQYLFNSEFDDFTFNFLIPKMVLDIEDIKSNWQIGHYLLKKIYHTSENSKGVYCLQYDSKQIVSGFHDNNIKIFDRNTLKCVKVLTGHTGSILCLQYDEKIIFSGSSDTTICVWNINTGIIVNTLMHHHDAVLHLKFNHNTLVSCSKDRTIAVWDMMSPYEVTLRRVLFDHNVINMVDFDSKYIVSASEDCTIRVWDMTNYGFIRDLCGHKHSVVCLQYKDRLVVSGSTDNTIRLWDIEYGVCLRVLEDHNEQVQCVQFDSKIIVSGTRDGEIKIWNLEKALDPTVLTSNLCLRTLKAHTDTVFKLQFDKFHIVSCSNDGTILLWDFLNYNATDNTAAVVK